jgi:hypothetical protein
MSGLRNPMPSNVPPRPLALLMRHRITRVIRNHLNHDGVPHGNT